MGRARLPGASHSSNRLLAVTPVDQPGGAETALLRLLRRLSTTGLEIAITTPGRGSLHDAAPGARVVLIGDDPYRSDPEYTRAAIGSAREQAKRFYTSDYVDRVEALIAPSSSNSSSSSSWLTS